MATDVDVMCPLLISVFCHPYEKLFTHEVHSVSQYHDSLELCTRLSLELTHNVPAHNRCKTKKNVVDPTFLAQTDHAEIIQKGLHDQFS